MDIKQIKELVTFMEKSGVKKLSMKEKSGFEIQIERQDEHAPHPPVVSYPSFYPHPPAEHGRPPSHAMKETAHVGSQEQGKYVLSPMVGTFYSAPSPDDPAFVKVGDRVEAGAVLCIIEAMKVMNEVKAQISGTLAEILVDNTHPVEFGTKLFRIE